MKNNKLTATYVKDILNFMSNYHLSEVRVGKFQFLIVGNQYSLSYKDGNYENNIVETDKKKFIETIKMSELYGMEVIICC